MRSTKERAIFTTTSSAKLTSGDVRTTVSDPQKFTLRPTKRPSKSLPSQFNSSPPTPSPILVEISALSHRPRDKDRTLNNSKLVETFTKISTWPKRRPLLQTRNSQGQVKELLPGSHAKEITQLTARLNVSALKTFSISKVIPNVAA